MMKWKSDILNKVRVAVVALMLLSAATAMVSINKDNQRARTATPDRIGQNSSLEQQVTAAEKQILEEISTETVETEVEVPYSTTTTYDGTLEKDTTVVRVEGQIGKKVIRTVVKTKDGVEISRELISEDTIVPPVTRVVAVGTKVVQKQRGQSTVAGCNRNYRPCIPDSSRDLNCEDLERRVEIIGDDEYELDEDDADGIGCESYEL